MGPPANGMNREWDQLGVGLSANARRIANGTKCAKPLYSGSSAREEDNNNVHNYINYADYVYVYVFRIIIELFLSQNLN